MFDGDAEINLCRRLGVEEGSAEPPAKTNPVDGSSMSPTGGPSGTRNLPEVEAKYTAVCSSRQFVDSAVDQILAMANKNDRFVDDITGQPLPPELCREARRVEVEYFRTKGVWELRKISEALQRTG